MEALRRLRRNSSENNVDRRLVTNMILSFLQIPRGDTKRFEILSLLASILSWTDQEREKAGLQRAGNSELGNPSPSTFWARSPNAITPTKSNQEKDETEVRSVFHTGICRLTVFLLCSLFLVCGSNSFLRKQRPVKRLRLSGAYPTDLPRAQPH